MRAIVIAKPGGPEVLELREVPTPEPARGEVRVRVRATAINRADLLQRLGMYPAPADAPKDIPGLEFAGEVEALGEGVTAWKPGDRVFGLTGGGAYAEQLVVHARTLARIPDHLDFTQAAAVPEAFITAYDAMVTVGHLGSGERLLVSAVGSGVGTAAVQLARALGAVSFGTARTAAKLDRAQELGLDHGIVPADGKFARALDEMVLRETGSPGIDVFCELVGGPYLAEDALCAAPRARIVLVGMLAGNVADIDYGLVLRKRLRLEGTVMRARPLEEKIAVTQVFARHVVPLFAASRQHPLVPVVDRVFALAEAPAAHTYVASNDGFGKTVLEV
jgi:putative PIG3 family NAD(P)H quinone oxidoreductase